MARLFARAAQHVSRCFLILAYAPRDIMSPGIDAWYKAA
jgi:hypothetical protein